jgi:hypothetical protein
MADLPTLLSLVRVSPASNSIATASIWRVLYLFDQSESDRYRYSEYFSTEGILALRDRTANPSPASQSPPLAWRTWPCPAPCL